MIDITKPAEDRFNELIEETGNEYVRLSIQGGGCSGFSYDFDFDDTMNEDDFQFGKLLVDFVSMQYLSGSKVDFIEDELGFKFDVHNPNAQTTCGCGSSFSV